MPIEAISIRLAAVALIVAALAACSDPSHERPLGAEAAAANRDALKGFSSGKAPAWETHKSSAKPGNYTPWEEGKTTEDRHHE